MSAIRATTEALAFGLEIAMLAAYAIWAGSLAQEVALSIALSVAVLLALIAVWGLFLAPKSNRRLRYPWRVLAELALMAGAVVALWLAGQGNAAIAFAVLVGVRFGLGFALGIDRDEALPAR